MDEKSRFEHDMKSATNALANFIKVAKLGESFTEGDGPEYVKTAEEALKVVDEFVRQALKALQTPTS